MEDRTQTQTQRLLSNGTHALGPECIHGLFKLVPTPSALPASHSSGHACPQDTPVLRTCLPSGDSCVVSSSGWLAINESFFVLFPFLQS